MVYKIERHAEKKSVSSTGLSDMSGEITDVYAVVDKIKKKRNKSMTPPSKDLHEDASVTDLYAVVDKSKKLENKSSDFPSQQLQKESITDVYSVVDKIVMIKPESNDKGDYYVLPTEEIPKIDDVTQIPKTDDSTLIPKTDDATRDFASVPVYDKANRTREYENKSVAKEISEHTFKWEHKKKTNREIQRKYCKYPAIFASCLTVLIAAVVVAAVAVVVALALIAGLHSELNSVMKQELIPSNFKQKLDQLQHDFYSFSSNTSDLLVGISQSTSESASNWRQQANFTFGIIQSFGEAISLLRIDIREFNTTFIQQINGVENATSVGLQNLKIEVAANITAANNNFRDRLTGVQTLLCFDSCAAVFYFSTQFPPGYYMIRSGDSVREEYCINACNNIYGGWKRIAYLNTEENPVACPDGFELRDDTSNPPLCRRTNSSAGCSSVIYPSNGMSYSQVCGTVRVHPAGTPDGFNADDSSMHYDGVYLTYGRNHMIWTYTAAVTVESNTRGCDQCNYMKPSNIPGTNFTCTTAHCSDADNCYPDTLWGNEAQQCFGNETFYRQLSVSTTDNIEMRVCRGQGRNDEDILISFVEMFVL